MAQNLCTEYDAIILLGCIIKGETPHFDIISQSISDKVLETSLDKNTPIIFGVLTTNNENEAEERAASKGSEFALSALSVLDTLKKIK
jgi:6,7-dimethyl-8-ribityllumazine synthase